MTNDIPKKPQLYFIFSAIRECWKQNVEHGEHYTSMLALSELVYMLTLASQSTIVPKIHHGCRQNYSSITAPSLMPTFWDRLNLFLSFSRALHPVLASTSTNSLISFHFYLPPCVAAGINLKPWYPELWRWDLPDTVPHSRTPPLKLESLNLQQLI